MEKHEKLAYLKDADFDLFIKTRQMVFDEFSSQLKMLCCCGMLATSLHKRRCTKFNNKVDTETIKRLSHLLPKKGSSK